jgi:hypothetical protein
MSSNTLAAAPAPNTTGTVNVAPRRSKRAIIREEQYNNQSRRRQRQNEREIPQLDDLINHENMPEPVGIPRNQVNQRMVDFERQQQANNDEFQEEQQQARGKRSRKSRTRKSRRSRKSRRTRRNRRY